MYLQQDSYINMCMHVISKLCKLVRFMNIFFFSDCHFTCHQNCGALVRLGCKSKSSPDLAAGQFTEPPLLEPTDTLQTVSSDGSSEPTNVSLLLCH